MRITRIIILLVCFNLSMAFVILIRLLLTDLESQTFQATEEVMVDTSKRFAQQVEAQLRKPEELNTEVCQAVFPACDSEHTAEIRIYKLLKKRVGLHHYVTDQQGVVLFDSQFPARVGQDFSGYNDVMLTLRGEYGARSSRFVDDDPQTSIFYVGAPIYHQDQIVGALSLYKQQSDVTPFVSSRRRHILQACILMGVGTVLFVATVFFWVYRPIGRLTRYARGVVAGRRPPFPKLGRGREINTLGQALRTMRETLEGRDYAKNYVQTLTHELKSPISAIKATAELLQEDMPAEQRRKFLHTIISQVERSEKALTRLQQLSHVEKMTELERTEEVRLDQLLQELISEYTPVAKAQKVTLNLSAEPAKFTGDPFLLRAIFQNLIDNAIKYSPERGEVVMILQNTLGQLEVQITNGGDAVPEFAQGRIFERLFSLGDLASEKGSGIGLTLVKEAVTLHDGEVDYSYDGGQNVFRVVLPTKY